MSASIGLDKLTAPQRFCLPAGYQQRLQPEYFTDDADDGISWQPDVYPYAADLARHFGRNTIIDIGCGRAGKLAAMHRLEPAWQYIGVDVGPNIKWCEANHTFGTWIEADLEACTVLPIPADLLRQAIIVCSDVLEHLVRADIAMGLMWTLAKIGGDAPVVLSTPAREHRTGADYHDQPRNPAHVREWTSDEFTAFVTGSGFSIRDVHLTRSDDRSNGMTTQLVTALPTSRRNS
jgi:hypothetical protein